MALREVSVVQIKDHAARRIMRRGFAKLLVSGLSTAIDAA